MEEKESDRTATRNRDVLVVAVLDPSWTTVLVQSPLIKYGRSPSLDHKARMAVCLASHGANSKARRCPTLSPSSTTTMGMPSLEGDRRKKEADCSSMRERAILAPCESFFSSLPWCWRMPVCRGAEAIELSWQLFFPGSPGWGMSLRDQPHTHPNTKTADRQGWNGERFDAKSVRHVLLQTCTC
jgi:hypothetical protein